MCSCHEQVVLQYHQWGSFWTADGLPFIYVTCIALQLVIGNKMTCYDGFLWVEPQEGFCVELAVVGCVAASVTIDVDIVGNVGRPV